MNLMKGYQKKAHGYKNVEFVHKDFMEANISKVDLIYIFKPFIESSYGFVRKLKEAAPGTIIISRDFPYSPIGGSMMIHILDNNDFDPGDFLMIGRPVHIGDSNFFTYVRR